MQFVFWIRPVGPGNQRLLVIVLRVGITAGHLIEMPELQQDLRILRLQAERLQVSRFRLAEVPPLFVHVTALEKQKDIKVRRPGAQRLVVEFGGDQILLAIPCVIRKAEQFFLRLASRHGADNCAERSFDIHWEVIHPTRIVLKPCSTILLATCLLASGLPGTVCRRAAERGIVLLYDSSPARGLTSRLVSEADSAPRNVSFSITRIRARTIVGLAATETPGTQKELTCRPPF